MADAGDHLQVSFYLDGQDKPVKVVTNQANVEALRALLMGGDGVAPDDVRLAGSDAGDPAFWLLVCKPGMVRAMFVEPTDVQIQQVPTALWHGVVRLLAALAHVDAPILTQHPEAAAFARALVGDGDGGCAEC